MGENCVSLVTAIEQMQELDQRLKKLEEPAEEKQTNEASSKEQYELSEEKCGESDGDQRLLEIRAKVNRTNVLLKLQCEKRKGVLVKLLTELDKLNLDVISASVVPFGPLVLDITITAEVTKEEFSGSAEDVVATIRNCLHSDA
ncbi:Transcription factor bHLH19 [Striga hermonthica]|uniref:Transcription factor bHLH19 n=1 Tax=Striga hermonthica TaxID=68872 RepID=A0A9N7RPU9_STRHE|nr:Transcription factor bHLH19 [Striga hermonthica]